MTPEPNLSLTIPLDRAVADLRQALAGTPQIIALNTVLEALEVEKDEQFRAQVGMVNAMYASFPLQQALAAFGGTVTVGNAGRDGQPRVIGSRKAYEATMSMLPLQFPPLPDPKTVREVRLKMEEQGREAAKETAQDVPTP